jgi:hypothetical protein
MLQRNANIIGVIVASFSAKIPTNLATVKEKLYVCMLNQ